MLGQSTQIRLFRINQLPSCWQLVSSISVRHCTNTNGPDEQLFRLRTAITGKTGSRQNSGVTVDVSSRGQSLRGVRSKNIRDGDDDDGGQMQSRSNTLRNRYASDSTRRSTGHYTPANQREGGGGALGPAAKYNKNPFLQGGDIATDPSKLIYELSPSLYLSLHEGQKDTHQEISGNFYFLCCEITKNKNAL